MLSQFANSNNLMLNNNSSCKERPVPQKLKFGKDEFSILDNKKNEDSDNEDVRKDLPSPAFGANK